MSPDRATSEPTELAEAARDKLSSTRFSGVQWISSTGSTNSDLLEEARNGAGEGLVLVADRQTAGRGRRGRSWQAPAGSSLMVSVLLRPPARVAPAVTMAVGVAMVDAVRAVAGVDVGLKWPNDLVAAGEDGEERKLAGILAETDWPPGATIAGGWREPSANERVTVVAGVGLNCNWSAKELADLPPDVLDRAVALNGLRQGGTPVDRLELLVAFLVELERRYAELVAAVSAASLLEAWRERAVTLGRRVRVDLGADDVEGVAEDITDEGHLVVTTLEGERRNFAVGDIVHLRTH